MITIIPLRRTRHRSHALRGLDVTAAELKTHTGADRQRLRPEDSQAVRGDVHDPRRAVQFDNPVPVDIGNNKDMHHIPDREAGGLPTAVVVRIVGGPFGERLAEQIVQLPFAYTVTLIPLLHRLHLQTNPVRRPDPYRNETRRATAPSGGRFSHLLQRAIWTLKGQTDLSKANDEAR